MQLPTKFLVPTEIDKSELARYSKNADEVAQLGFGLDYKKRWTVWMAIREFVQNAFDVITSENPRKRENLDQVELKYDTKRKIGYIVDQGSGIKFKNMFLAENKGGQEWEARCLRGRFGEGMKYALLPLLRGKHQILIRTVGADYHFTSVLVGKGREKFSLIHMLQTPNKNKKGTCIAISGVDPNDFRYRFIPFLESDNPDAVLLSATQGCIVRQALAIEVQNSGALYVRDIYVSKINSYYSYNFWFEDTTHILDPNRNHLKVDDHEKHIVGEEFFKLLEQIDTPKGRQFWKSLFTAMYQDTLRDRNPQTFPQTSKRKVRRSKRTAINTFEWKYLDEYEYEELLYEKSEILFEIISEVVGTSEFSWSENYREGKTLEHFGVLDLRDRLPNLFYQISDFIKSPAQLKQLDELQEKLVVLPPSAFKVINRRFAEKIENLHEELVEVSEDMLNVEQTYNDEDTDLDWRRELNNIFFYTGSYKEGAEGVAGFYSSADNAVYIHAKYFLDSRFFVKVFIHEMAHAYCDSCDDITEEFENSLEEMAFAYQDCDYRKKNIWKYLRNIYWELEDNPGAKEKFFCLLGQTNEGIQKLVKEQKSTKRRRKKLNWAVQRANRRKREQREKKNNVFQLLRRADVIYNQGLDITLPDSKKARQMLDVLPKPLRRPPHKRGKVGRARIQKWQDDNYINFIDRNRAIAALRRGAPDDWAFLDDKKIWDSPFGMWRKLS